MKCPRPLIDVTDLYHPHQDFGDNFDLVLPYALSDEIDLRAVVLDCTQRFREAYADHPDPQYRDAHGPREPGFIPVHQLNYLFDRTVPAGVGPFTPLKSPDDAAEGTSRFQSGGIELILRTLREATEPVDIAVFSSCRAVAAAFNREPQLFRERVERLHLSVGGAPHGYWEWNVMLDPHAFVCLLRSGLPINLFPCATQMGPFDRGQQNTFWSLPDLHWMAALNPGLRRYLVYGLQRLNRVDYFGAMEHDWPGIESPESYLGLHGMHHNVWETAVWMEITGRKLVRRRRGGARLLRPEQITETDTAVPYEMRPVTLEVKADGQFHATPGPEDSPTRLYFRADPVAHEAALREALPALYASFRPALVSSK